MSDDLTPAQAAAQLEAIYQNKNHDLYALDDERSQRGLEEVMRLTRIKLGAAGALVTDTADGGPLTTSTPSGSGPGAPSSDQPITTRETVLAFAEEMGFDKGELGALMDVEARTPSGRHTLETALHGFGPVERAQLRRLHRTGMGRLPLSLQLHLEQRGTAFAPGVFSRIVELGQELEHLDEQIASESAKNPASARLKELVRRRHGRQNVILF